MGNGTVTVKSFRLPLAELADTGRIGILGHSRAGGGTIIFAAEHPEVAALVVWNGGSLPPPPGQFRTAQRSRRCWSRRMTQDGQGREK